jgi:N-acetyl-anhydromuramyl-L-alanine amidase AmpD
MAIADRSESRDGYAVRVLAVHTTEGYGTAEQLRDATWWKGSSHAIADDTGTLLGGLVPYERASWTLRSGNRWSENIELIGWAAWTEATWLEKKKPLLDACARWLAERSKARGIPLVKLTPEEYAAGGTGVIGHADHTYGYHDGSHTDPGIGFPWDYVLTKAREYAAEGFLMALSDKQQEQVYEWLEQLTRKLPSLDGIQAEPDLHSVVGFTRKIHAFVYRLYARDVPALRAEVAELKALLTATG